MKVADCDSTLPHPRLLQRPGSPLSLLFGERQLLAVLPDAQVQRLHMLARPPLLHLRQQTLPLALLLQWPVMHLSNFCPCLKNRVVHPAQQRPHKQTFTMSRPAYMFSRVPCMAAASSLQFLLLRGCSTSLCLF